MTNFLSKLFIKNPQNYSSPQVRQAYGILCGALGIFLNLLLFAGKWLAGTLSGSIAITADAFNNLSDAGSSVITLIGFKLSGQKPDIEHPFGHGRMEYISGLFVSAAILIMGFELIKTSFEKILHPENIDSSPLVLIILVVSILTKLYMSFYNRSIGKKIDSTAMMATANDSLSDTAATTLVLAATLISHFTGLKLDGWFGVLVGVFIFYTGITTMKDTLDPLLGQPPSEEFVAQIHQIVMENDTVYGIHDLIVHDYGPGRCMISLHAEVPANGDLLSIHDEIDNIENELEEKLHCSATIHMDPIVTDNEEVNYLRAETEKIVKNLDPTLTIHDFRIVDGATHTNLIFDIAVPFTCSISDAKICTDIKNILRTYPGKKLHPVIHIDRTYASVH